MFCILYRYVCVQYLHQVLKMSAEALVLVMCEYSNWTCQCPKLIYIVCDFSPFLLHALYMTAQFFVFFVTQHESVRITMEHKVLVIVYALEHR